MLEYQREVAEAIFNFGVFNGYKTQMGLRPTRPEAMFEPVR